MKKLLLLLGLVVIAILNQSCATNQAISNDCLNGFCTKIYASGNKYEGEWKDGQRHGQGTMTFKSGTIYESEWKDGNRNGHCI